MKRTPLQRKTPLKRTRTMRSSRGSKLKRAVIEAAVTITVDGVVLGRVKRLHMTKTTKHARRERGREYMAWTSRQPCMVARFWQRLHTHAGNRRLVLEMHLCCDGPIQVDHAGNRFTDGDGTRAFDRTVIPMCRKHHEQRTNACGTPGQAGIFAGFDADMVRAWSDEAIRIHQSLARFAGIAIPDC